MCYSWGKCSMQMCTEMTTVTLLGLAIKFIHLLCESSLLHVFWGEMGHLANQDQVTVTSHTVCFTKK